MSRANPRYRRYNAPLPANVYNIYELKAYYVIEGQTCINTFYYDDLQPAGTFSGAPEAELIAKWLTTVAPSIQNCMTTDCILNRVTAQCLNAPTRIVVNNVGTVNLAGLVATPHEPTTVAAVVQRKTAFKGQSGRGRFSLPGLPQSFTTNSSLTTAGSTAFGTMALATAAAMTTTNNSFAAGLVSRRGKAPSVTYGFGNIFTLTVDPVLGTIRRRKLGRGK
jgi:hypothetical protein